MGMGRRFFSILLLASLCSFGCSEDPGGPAPLPDPVTPVDPTPDPDPVDPENPDLDGYSSVSLHSELTHVQPMTGIVLWSDNDYRKSDYVQLEFAYMLYNDVCKEKDVYDWSPMERLLDRAAAAGHQVVVRFRYAYVGKKCAVPDYIKQWPGYEETIGKSEGRTTYFPDWRCEELQRFHMEFHRLFAERYDKDPRLAFVETGFGLWAEYHIYDGPFILGKTFPSKEFQAKFLQAMDQWFVDTPWMFSIDAADSKYSPFSQQPELKDLTFGNFDDSFMCEDHDDYNKRSWKFFGEDRYQIAPFGGEFSYFDDNGPDYDQKHCLDKAGMYGRKFEDEAAKFHMTFIIGNDQPGYQKASRITEAAMSMGYRFRIEDYRVKPGTGAWVKVSNVGVAPIYRDAWIAVEGVRGKLNLRTLMPGDSQWVHVAAASVTADSRPVIACDHLVSGQEIEYEASL